MSKLSNGMVSNIKIVVPDHGKLMLTVEQLVMEDAGCHFCDETEITIVYRSWMDKLVAACAKHEEIVREMIERDNL